jgi:transglutaminase-like putative cysteine protease
MPHDHYTAAEPIVTRLRSTHRNRRKGLAGGAISRRRAAAALLVFAFGLVGCGDSPRSQAIQSDSSSDSLPQPIRAALADDWQVVYLEGKRVGHAHTSIERAEERGERLIHITGTMLVSFTRAGAKNDIRLVSENWLTPDGQLARFRSEATLGPSPTVTEGLRSGDVLRISTTTAGQKHRSEIPWSDSDLGSFGVEIELAQKPPKAGEARRLRILQPVFNEVADVELRAVGRESTPLLEGSADLLKVEVSTLLSGGRRQTSTLWVDDQGIIQKRTEEPGITSYKTTEAVASAPTEETPDLLALSLVKLDRPIDRPYATRRAKYKVTLANDDPLKVFTGDARQLLKSIDFHSAELEVLASDDLERGISDRTPTAADSEPCALIQSNDLKVRQLAAEAIDRSVTDPRRVALALAKSVHEKIRAKNFSQAFSTAAEVAQSLEGDCTEHSVLLAALARARGIPARVAMGLVYIPDEQAFGFHMWNEVFVDGSWRALDSTLGGGGVSATHIKLADSNLAEGEAFASFLPVAQVMGQLKLELLEVE